MSSPDSAASEDDELLDLVAECIERAEVEGPEAIEEVLARNPALRPALERRLEHLRGMGLLGSSTSQELPDRLGPFRLLERLGSGGMGVVFLAREDGLERDVALKVMRPEQLYFSEARARFRREVESVVRLQHPCILPVYAVGEDAGVPYFTMERVEGCSLADAIATVRGGDLPTRGAQLADAIQTASPLSASQSETTDLFDGSWEETCLRVIELAARALEHAHRRGVIHRDVKPSNLMVTPGGRVLLMDFGVARPSDAPRLTQSGARLGSIAYMSPEQARGEPLDATTDVYSLGATLYELLTLRPPHGDGDASNLLARVARGEPAPPVRAHRSDLSRDLDAVCSKALDAECHRRFASATHMAEDLRRVLRREPVTATPITSTRRALRWCRRHPARASVVALAGLLLLGGPSTFAVHEAHARSRLAEKNEVILAKSHVATQSMARALDALERMLDVARRELRDVAFMDEARQTILRDALELYKALEALETDDHELLRQRATAQRHGAAILADLGRMEEAQAMALRSIATLRTLERDQPDTQRISLELSRSLTSAASTFGQSGTFGRALALADEAEQRFEALRSAGALAGEARLGWFEVRFVHAETLRTMGRSAEAIDRLRACFAELAPVTSDDIDTQCELWMRRAEVGSSLGLLLFGDQREGVVERDEACAVLEETLATTESLVALRGSDATRWDLVLREVSRNNLAGFHRRLGALDVARRLYEASAEQLQTLVERYPTLPEPRRQWAAVFNNLGLVAETEGDARAALDWTLRAAEQLEILHRRFPALHRLRGNLATLHFNLSNQQVALGEFSAAETSAQSALHHATGAMEHAPEHATARLHVLESASQLTYTQILQHRFDDALETSTPLIDRITNADEAAWLLDHWARSVADILTTAGVEPRERREQADRFVISCLDDCDWMLDEGWTTIGALTTTPTLSALHAQAAFQEFLESR